MSNGDHLGLATFNELGNVVETKFDDNGPGAGAVLGLLVNLGVSVLLKSLLLFFSSFGSVLG
jgi:hypothetical protein